METPFSVLSTTISLLEHLGDYIRKRKRKKLAKERFSDALGAQIQHFVENFDEAKAIAETRLAPLLLAFKDRPTPSNINDIVDCLSDFNFSYAKAQGNFIEIVRGCYSITSYQTFMDSLKESSDLLSDFVLAMKNLLVVKGEKTRIKIDNGFYYFFKLYGNEILKEIDMTDVEDAAKEARLYIDFVEKKLKPSLRMSAIRRSTRGKFRKSLQELAKVSKKIRIRKTTLIEIRDYIPAKLRPIVMLIEETFPLEED
jgi:hypothetical protein